MYFIPNVGTLTTNADTSTCYYTNVSGDFMEGFGVKTSDWTEEKNRTLQLLNNGKIWIAQNYLSSNSDVATREWYLTNYLLLKSSQSYINVPTTDSNLYWWPEYNLALGSPKDALPTNISSYAVGNGHLPAALPEWHRAGQCLPAAPRPIPLPPTIRGIWWPSPAEATWTPTATCRPAA